MSKKNWSKLFNKKNRTHKDSYNFNNRNLDDIVDFGTKAYKFDGKRWKESKEEDEQELEMSDSYTVNNSDSFASSKALFDLNAKVASDLTGIYTKSETDLKIVALSPPTDISGKFDKSGGTISGDITVGTVTGKADGTDGGKTSQPFKLSEDTNSYMMTVAGNTWGLFWAGNAGAKYGTNGNGGPGDIWGNSANPNEFAFIGSDLTRWTLNGNNGKTWQGGACHAPAFIGDGSQLTGVGGGLIRASTAPAGVHSDGTEWLDTSDNKLYKYLSITAADTTAGVTDTWRPISSANGSVLVGQPEYKYRHIYAHSYTGMGYKSGTPWKNVNRTDHINDTTTNLGDRFDRSQGYCDAGWDDTSEIIYAHGIGNLHSGSHNYTSTYNMRTDTGLGGSANMSIARGDAGVSVDMTRRFGYIGGGGSASFTKMSYTTNVGVHSGDIAGPSSGAASTAHFGEHYGWHNNNGTALKFDFATTTATAWARTYGVAGCQKAMSSKNGVGLAGRNGECGSSDGWDEYNDSTGSYNWHGTKPYQSIGEENYSMGQDKGYCIGAFDGANQGNFSFVWNYASRSGNSLGAAGQPKGHDGMSSGFGCSRKG
jgi:hypothetical protein